MSKKRGGVLLVSVGVLMALVAGWLAYSQLKAAEKRVEQVPGRRVVVATQDIPEQGRIALSAVTLATISDEALPARPYTSVSEAVGKFARQRIYRGDILTQDRVVGLQAIRGAEAGATAETGAPAATGRTRGTGGGQAVLGSPSLVLDKDQMMVVVPARLQGNFAAQSPNLLTEVDAVHAGDYLDVLVTTLELPETMTREQREEARRDHPWDYLRTRVMFQNLRVHHVGEFEEAVQTPSGGAGGVTASMRPQARTTKKAKPEDRYLTFVVDRDTALQLKWLKDIVALGHASVEFALRSPGNPEVTPATPLTVQDIQRQYGVYGGRQ
jgi:Flp pilus assembly protein CpaB